MVLCLPDSRSNWILEMMVFEEKGKPEYQEKDLSEEGREQTTNLTPIWRRDLNPGNIGGRRALTTAPSWPPFFLLISRAPFHTWRKIYENASVCFCPKMPRTSDLCLTPPPPIRPVDFKRGESEYVDIPLASPSRYGYLTIIPRARMGYWLKGHECERNNCFSKIQLVGQKYRE